MLSDLFSQFDPRTRAVFKCSFLLFWLGCFSFIFFIVPSPIFIGKSAILLSFRKRLKLVFSMCLEFGIGGFQGMAGVLVVTFFFLLFVNFFGLFPATFSISSQFLYTITLAVPL